MMTRKGWTAAILAVLLAGVGGYLFTVPPSERRSLREFDPERTADLELRMWQAYYAKSRIRLFGLLVTLLREQYHYSWSTATTEGFHLARAAATFGDLKGDYEQVLPDLERAYTTAARWHRAGFDPRAVARAELAWWVARRIPGQNDPEQVGLLIAQEYALLYETTLDRVLTAGRLRAEAGALRDREAQKPDWPTIGALLRDSYRSLRSGLSTSLAAR
jgi:hypothetical protein